MSRKGTKLILNKANSKETPINSTSSGSTPLETDFRETDFPKVKFKNSPMKSIQEDSKFSQQTEEIKSSIEY